jgi:O-antigen/teichoic acid export membrane protein
LIGPGLFFLLIPLADYLSNQFTLAVTQKVLNGAEVSRLSTHRTIASFGPTVSALLTTAIWPELTALHALHRRNPLSRVHQSLAKFNLWLVGAACFGMLPFLPIVYPVWTARELTLDYWTLGFLLARVSFWGIWNASLTVLCATNRHYKLGFILLAEGILTGAMSLFLVPSMGIRGAALSALVADLCVSAWIIPLLALRETGDTFVGFAISNVKAMAAVAIPVGIGMMGWHFVAFSYLRWGVVLPACVLLALGLMIHQLDAFERNAVLHLYRQIFKKAKPPAQTGRVV